MNEQSTSKTGLFLIELIISIFFFIIIAVICIQLFVKAQILSDNTINLNHSVMWLENISEMFIANNGDYEKLLTLCSDMNSDDPNNISIYFDDNWEMINNKASASFKLITTNEITSCESGHFSKLNIQVIEIDSNKTLYENTIQEFIPGGIIYGKQ